MLNVLFRGFFHRRSSGALREPMFYGNLWCVQCCVSRRLLHGLAGTIIIWFIRVCARFLRTLFASRVRRK